MSPLSKATIATVGSGVMAEAMIAGLLRGKLVEPGQVVASHPRAERREHLAREYGIRTVADNTEAVKGADVILFGIKPQMLVRVGREIGPHLRRGQLVLSVLAGATTDRPDRDPRPRPGRPQHAQHAGPPRQGHDRLVRDARDDRGAARPGGGAARLARRPARGRRREDGRDGHRGQRHRPDLRVPRHGGAHRRGRPPRLPAPHRPRPRHRDARGLDALREAVRDAPGRAAQHGHLARRDVGGGAPRARIGSAADRAVRGGLGGVPADRRARRSARGVGARATADRARAKAPDRRRNGGR